MNFASGITGNEICLGLFWSKQLEFSNIIFLQDFPFFCLIMEDERGG